MARREALANSVRGTDQLRRPSSGFIRRRGHQNVRYAANPDLQPDTLLWPQRWLIAQWGVVIRSFHPESSQPDKERQYTRTACPYRGVTGRSKWRCLV